MRHTRLWWLWTAAGCLATGGYFLLPHNGLTASLAYNAIGLISGLAILAGVRLHRPQRPAAWYWFAAGQIVWVGGDMVYEFYQFALHEQPYPSVADIFYMAAYPMLAVGLFLIVRERRGRDQAGLVDAAIVATGLGLVLWLFVLHPLATDGGAPVLERVVSTAYPAADVLLLGLLARLFTGSVVRTASARLLAVAVLLLLVSDVAFSLISLYSDYDGGLVDTGWLLSYVLWAAAALHPSMRSHGIVPERARATRVGRGRMVVLAISSLLAPAMLFVPGIGVRTGDRVAIGAGSVVLFVLVVLRMSGFVAQVQRQTGQLEDLAMRDDLTGLANRRRFMHELAEALTGGPAQVALLDLNGFKAVNDRLGHSVGDRLLIVLARRLADDLGADALVARLGGDEFALLIRGADDAGTDAVVDRLAATLRDPVPVFEHDLLVVASIGVAGGERGTDAVELLRRADVAMYAAKDHGERRRRYEPSLDARASEQARIGAELRTALDAGQFRVVYQPIVSLPDGRLFAVEALVRWDHPERGVINPADFIPVAEKNGLIVELGAWILREACVQAARWRARYGPDKLRRISVNVSARQLAEPGLLDAVTAALEVSGLGAAHLTIEVTETAVFDSERALSVLNDLKQLGVRIALDDFGTGQSSLSLLQTMPVDVLKVDKSFVDTITMAGRHAVIATALIQVANGLGLTAVAEGVETAEQAAELYRMGYQLAQGYHFGRPADHPALLDDFVGGRR